MTQLQDNVDLDTPLRDTATARKYFDAGRKAEDAGARQKAIDAYEAAYAADPDDPEVCFRLAQNLDLVGEEDEAVHLYEQAVDVAQPHLNALMNLAVMYEDRGKYSAAERCLRQVLATDPNHVRARLYVKDVVASHEMEVEESDRTVGDVPAELVDVPVTDFELSVRTRNALRKMNIRTLADLLRVTEPELRAYKNFDEDSIAEIKAMLGGKGLKLGQLVASAQSEARKAAYEQVKDQTGSNDAVLEGLINELKLSVRSRKALNLLGVMTIGDLCSKTEAELMGIKNFGLTSLDEVHEKLGELGLELRHLEVDEAAIEEALADDGEEAEEAAAVRDVEEETEAEDEES